MVRVRIEERKKDLTVGNYLLRKHPKNLKNNEWHWTKRILRDHPSFSRAWKPRTPNWISSPGKATHG